MTTVTQTQAARSNVEVIVQDARTGDELRRIEAHNITTRGLHERLITAAGPDRPEETEAVRLAIGDGTTEPETTDDELENRVDDVPVTGSAVDGNELTTSAFVDSTVANGEAITEIGLLTADDVLLNRALVESVEKSSSIILTVNVTLSLIDQTEVQ